MATLKNLEPTMLNVTDEIEKSTNSCIFVDNELAIDAYF